MSRNALIASLAGALALGLSAFSAQAASVPMSDDRCPQRQDKPRPEGALPPLPTLIAIIGTIATTGTIADGNARVSGSTIDAVMHRAGSTGLPVQPALFYFEKQFARADFLASAGRLPFGHRALSRPSC